MYYKGIDDYDDDSCDDQSRVMIMKMKMDDQDKDDDEDDHEVRFKGGISNTQPISMTSHKWKDSEDNIRSSEPLESNNYYYIDNADTKPILSS